KLLVERPNHCSATRRHVQQILARRRGLVNVGRLGHTQGKSQIAQSLLSLSDADKMDACGGSTSGNCGQVPQVVHNHHTG
ncbi:hypothetical protein F442_22507, partial [Phytophthora nicotianae P10297]